MDLRVGRSVFLLFSTVLLTVCSVSFYFFLVLETNSQRENGLLIFFLILLFFFLPKEWATIYIIL